jgi:hypothetical protein
MSEWKEGERWRNMYAGMDTAAARAITMKASNMPVRLCTMGMVLSAISVRPAWAGGTYILA